MSSKKMSRREMLRLAGLSVAGAALAACQPVVVEQAAEGVEAPAKEAVTLQANIAFTQSDYGLQYQIVQQWRDLFQQTNPGITVDLAFVDWGDHHNKMLVLAAAGELPDFIEVQASRSQLWIKEGVFLPMDEYAAADPDYDLADFFDDVMPYYQREGMTYAAPYDHGPVIIAYNKDMFDEFGVDYPEETWTMDTLLETAKTFTTEETWGYTGMPGDWLLEPQYLMPWGGLLFNEDETECLITMPESIEALQWWVDMRFKHEVVPTPAASEVLATAGGDFVSGKVAMTRSAPWNAPTYNALAKFDWDVAPWPKGPVMHKTSGLGSGYGTTRDTEHPEEAWLWLDWMTSKEGLSFVWAASGGSTPPRKSVFDVYLTAPGVAEHAQFFLDAMNDYMGIGRPISPFGAEFTSIRDREMDLMLTGIKSVEEAAADMKADGDPILAQNAG